MIPSQLEASPTPPAPKEEQKLDLAKLREQLYPRIKTVGLAFKGMTISGLNIDKFDPAKVYGGGLYYVTVNQVIEKSTYKSCLIIKKAEYDNLADKSIMSPGRKVEVRIVGLTLNKGTDIQIYADQIRENGLSDYEIANRRIKAECERLGYFKREKRKRPPFFIRIGLITSSAGGVASDIMEVLAGSGLPSDNITINKCGSAAEMTENYMAMSASGMYDAICFFRGGNEDPTMAIFRDIDLFKVIGESSVFTASGLNHEQDHPIIEGIVDECCNTPTAFGEMVVQHNKACMDDVLSLIETVKRSSVLVVDKICKDLTAHKNWADSYYKSSVKRIQESITTQFADAYISAIRSIIACSGGDMISVDSSFHRISMGINDTVRGNKLACRQECAKAVTKIIACTAGDTISVGNSNHRISMGINDTIRGNKLACRQEGTKAVTKISGAVNQASHQVSKEYSRIAAKIYDSIGLTSREAGRAFDVLSNRDSQMKQVVADKTDRMNKILLGFAAGTVAGLFAGVTFRSVPVGIFVGVAVGLVAAAFLLSPDRR